MPHMLEIEPPILLQEMRAVYRGHKPETAGDEHAAEWLKTDPKGFRREMSLLEQQLENKLIAQAQGLVVKWDGKGECPACGRAAEVAKVAEADAGSDRIDDLIEKGFRTLGGEA